MKKNATQIAIETDPLYGIKVLAGHHFDETIGRDMKVYGISDSEYADRRADYEKNVASSSHLIRLVLNAISLGDPEL